METEGGQGPQKNHRFVCIIVLGLHTLTMTKQQFLHYFYWCTTQCLYVVFSYVFHPFSSWLLQSLLPFSLCDHKSVRLLYFVVEDLTISFSPYMILDNFIKINKQLFMEREKKMKEKSKKRGISYK